MTDKTLMPKAFVPRITQLDANEFDQEIRNVLFAQLMEVSKYLTPGAFNNKKAEINLILDLLIFYYSVITKNATFGQELLGLKYKNVLSRTQLTVYVFLNYLLPYLKVKLENITVFIVKEILEDKLDKLNACIAVFNVLNTLVFLRENKYPTIVDRLLKLTYSSVNRLNPFVGYNYMTRELLWHGFRELLITILPLINYSAIKRDIRKLFITKSCQTKCKKKIKYNTETKCVICDDFPVLPCKISTYCPHVACYYCLKSNILADDKFACLVCQETNTAKENLKFLGK